MARITPPTPLSGIRDTPFSGTGASGDTSNGLGARYSRDQLYGDCVNGIGPPLGAAPPTTAAPPPPAP